MTRSSQSAGQVTTAWQALERHREEVSGLSLAELLADADRVEELDLDAAGLHLDLSKNRVTAETVELMGRLARAVGLPERRDAMLAGQRVNPTEGRAALHTALRLPRGRSLVVDGVDVVGPVHEVLDRMAAFSDALRAGEWRGHTGRPIRNVVNIGIGGSDLGPAMATTALSHHAHPGLEMRFVSNVDGSALSDALEGLDAEETLFIVCSKTFTTLETMTNARTARRWLIDSLGAAEEAVSRHFAAVSTNLAGATEFGISEGATFGFWDWVGGRYSMCSAVGLPIMLAIGPEGFRRMLAGFHAMDEHFADAPLERNAPILHGLIGAWHSSILGAESHAVVPYEERLRLLPAYLQQLTMESNGKRVRIDGGGVEGETGAILWGEPGTDGQHSFFQLLHQGTRLVPLDLILMAQASHGLEGHHDLLAANALAQAEALAIGRGERELRESGVAEELVPHRVMPGGRPSTTIMAERLDPATLGALVALYEHSTFTQAAIWEINPFDQWGVELGKELAGRIAPELTAGEEPELGHDASTNALIRRYRRLRSG